MPGQYAGFLGATNDPFLIPGDLGNPDFKPLSLTLPDDMSQERIAVRVSLRLQLDDAALCAGGTRRRHPRSVQ